eukprot:TRINITY_DN202_c0_g1_i3.p2 TRINITY_DN202_c0_g1~~TRINITY_DN202_c0_g1_i3.p2  ORF type:complete len:118 (+),score=55.86 TRINITY_DN202_c0_g1_i3:249-602(+)
MKVLSAYLLAVVGGNASPSADDVTAILGSVGISLDGEGQSQLDGLLAELEGKTVDEVMAAGHAQLAKIPGGGCGGGAAAAAPAAGGDAGGADKKEEKKPSSSSEDVGGGGGMFDDDY